MVVELYVQEILSNLRAVSHREVAGIENVDARYRAEAGSEKMDDIYRCIFDAAKRLGSRCFRFLDDAYIPNFDNASNFPEKITYDFNFSERRAINKAVPLEEAMHTFILEYALAKFYSIVNQSELSNKHSLQAIDAGNVLDELLYTKKPPRV